MRYIRDDFFGSVCDQCGKPPLNCRCKDDVNDWADQERKWLDTAVRQRHPRVTVALAASDPMLCDPLDQVIGTILGIYLFGNKVEVSKN